LESSQLSISGDYALNATPTIVLGTRKVDGWLAASSWMVGAPIRPSTTPFSTTPPNPPPFHVTYARGGDVDPPSVALAKALVPDFHFMPRPRAKAA